MQIKSRIPWKRHSDETKRRRKIQEEYNEKHGVTPTTIQKEIRDVIRATHAAEEAEVYGGEQTKVSKHV